MIESTVNKVSYTVQDNPVFPFNVRFFTPADIHCYLMRDYDEVELVRNLDFEVENKADYDTGANITLLFAPDGQMPDGLPVGAKLTIVRELGMTQEVNLPEYGKIPSVALEKQLDKFIMICQQLKEITSRSLVVPLGMNIDSYLESAFIALGYNLDLLIETAVNAIVYDVVETHNTSDTPHEDRFELIGAVEAHDNDLDAHGGLLFPGAIVATTTNTAPDGYLECDGASLTRAGYARLFTAIGTIYGSADEDHFNIPDYRGQFLRGWDHGAGNDPDAANRTDRGDGTTGDVVGSKQADELGSHTHYTPGTPSDSSGGVILGAETTTNSPIADGGIETMATGGNETRPTNINVMYCIKY